MCSAISFPAVALICTKYTFKLCPSFNLNTIERKLLYKIWKYGGLFIIYLGAYNTIYFSSNSSCIQLHLYIAVRQFGSFRLQFCSMKSISSSQCLTSVFNAWSWLLDIQSLLLFNTRWITTVKAVLGYCCRLPQVSLPTCSVKSISGCLMPSVSFFLTSPTSLANGFNIMPTHCRRNHSALLKSSKESEFSKVTKISSTTISQCRGPSHSYFELFCP